MKENVEVDYTKIKNFYSSKKKKNHTQSVKTCWRLGKDNYNIQLVENSCPESIKSYYKSIRQE